MDGYFGCIFGSNRPHYACKIKDKREKEREREKRKERERGKERKQASDTYNEHCNQQVLLGDLGMGEDVVQHRVHVTLVLLPKGEHTLVIVTCRQKCTLLSQSSHLCGKEYKLLDVSLFFYMYFLRISLA